MVCFSSEDYVIGDFDSDCRIINRNTEQSASFTRNGGITRLVRYGLKADGTYGKVDDLHITYEGNRIATVRDDADAVTQAGSMDYPGGASAMAFEYDSSGSLIKAIIFTATGEKGQTFDPDEENNIGSSIAVVYKADGTTVTFDACTNPSDSEKYATVPEGNYEVKVGYHKQDYAALRVSDVGTENFYDNSIELGMPNPSDTTTTKAKGINIHKPGYNNLTRLTSEELPISMGCLLIDRERWDSFIGIFNNPDQRKNTVGILIQR